jgi:hypothetical protein
VSSTLWWRDNLASFSPSKAQKRNFREYLNLLNMLTKVGPTNRHRASPSGQYALSPTSTFSQTSVGLCGEKGGK